MYQITTTNGVIGYTDTPEYCYRLRSGSPQVLRERDKVKATGIIYGGAVYNLPGHSEFPGAETAAVSEIDAGAVLNRQAAQIAAQEAAQQDTDEQIVDQAYRLSLLEMGVN